MKTVFDCDKNEKVEVVKLHAPGELKQRFISFGILKGASVKILEYAPSKATIEVRVGKMNIALRSVEAKMIEVK